MACVARLARAASFLWCRTKAATLILLMASSPSNHARETACRWTGLHRTRWRSPTECISPCKIPMQGPLAAKIQFAGVYGRDAAEFRGALLLMGQRLNEFQVKEVCTHSLPATRLEACPALAFFKKRARLDSMLAATPAPRCASSASGRRGCEHRSTAHRSVVERRKALFSSKKACLSLRHCRP